MDIFTLILFGLSAVLAVVLAGAALGLLVLFFLAMRRLWLWAKTEWGKMEMVP